MKYGYNKQLNMQFLDAVAKTKNALKKEGFGVLTEIDVKKTIKEKLDINYGQYIILGACNPPYALKSLSAEKEIGLLLPCNVIVYEEKSKIIVSAILPTSAMSIVENDELKDIASAIEDKLKKAIDSIN